MGPGPVDPRNRSENRRRNGRAAQPRVWPNRGPDRFPGRRGDGVIGRSSPSSEKLIMKIKTSSLLILAGALLLASRPASANTVFFDGYNFASLYGPENLTLDGSGNL